MIERVAFVGSERVVARCAASVASQAEWLLTLMQRLGHEAGVVRDGAKIQLGWTMLLLRRADSGLVVHAPDYDRDPFRDVTDDLTVSLEIQAKQAEMLRRLGIEGEAASFQDKVVTAKGVFSEERIYLERTPNPPMGDSGWYVGPVNSTRAAVDLEAHYVFQVLKLRPSIMQALALPAGYLVVFVGDTVDAVLGSDDVDVWAASGTVRSRPTPQPSGPGRGSRRR